MPYGKGLPVPSQLTKGTSFATVDLDEREQSATADATGTALLQFPYVQTGQWWRIERIVVASGSGRLTSAVVYQGDTALRQRERDGTPLPPGAVVPAEYPSYLTILPTSCLLIGITGADSGDQFWASAQYQVVQKITGQWS